MEQVPAIIGAAAALAFGACVGSFAVTVAYRLPREISIATPGSFCESCQRPIPWWANIPIFAYLALRGRCIMCGAPIAARHLGAELLLALLALYLYVSFPLAGAAARFIFVTALLICSLVDYDWRLIPNLITLPGVPVGFALAALAMPEVGWEDSLVGIALGGGFLFLTGYVYQLLRGQEGVGMGDVFLLAMVGAFIGWQGVLFTMFFGALLGSIGGLVVGLFGTPTEAPELLSAAREPAAAAQMQMAELAVEGKSAAAQAPRLAEPSAAQGAGAQAAIAGSEGPEATAEAEEKGVPLLMTAVPFGPFLSLAAAVYAVFQPLLTSWYLSH
jgi:leader peptidase (prepilin peptidase)/N-methyltransferase